LQVLREFLLGRGGG